jgi:hypothetical protein
MRVGYIIKSHSHTLEDAIYFKDVYSIDEDEQRDLICDACEYAWDHNDGWEWLRDSVIITLVCDGVDCGDFMVEVDYVPSFIVRRIAQ